MPKIRLDLLLIANNLAKDQKEAISLIMAGQVYNHHKRFDKAGELLNSNSEIFIKSNNSYVSRGALKLLKGLEYFNINPQNKVGLDIGCAIGGFSQVLLERNIHKLYAVDVGYGEFAWKLRNDSRVVLYEKTNARNLNEQMVDPVDLIVCDASFIKLKTVLAAALKLAKPQANLVALIKPQFEARKNLVEPGGLITSDDVHNQVIAEVSDWLTNIAKWRILGLLQVRLKEQKAIKNF